MALALFFSAYSAVRFGYNVISANRPLAAFLFGSGYAAGTRFGYNAFGFLQPYKTRRAPRPLNLNRPFSRPRRRMGYYGRSRRSGGYSAGYRAGRRAAMRGRRRYRRSYRRY